MLFFSEGSPLRRRPGGFPVAPWTPSGPILICVGKTSHEKQTSCGRQEKGLPFFSVSQRISPLRRRPKGFPLALWKPSAPLLRKGICTTKNGGLVKGKERAFLASSCFAEGFASAEATKGLSDRPLETFGPFAASRNLYIKRFPCGRQEKGLPILPRIAKGFAAAEATRGFPVAPWTPSGAPYRWGSGLCFAV